MLLTRPLALALPLLLSGLANCESLPAFRLTSLSGHTVTLPDAASGRVAILIIGFTQTSSKATAAWHQKIGPEFGQNPRYVIYDIAILEDVPRLLRGLVAGAIRKGIPAKLQDTFLTTFENEKEWKRVVGYSAKDDAYVTIVNEHGEILWQTHGLTADTQLANFRDHARVAAPVAH